MTAPHQAPLLNQSYADESEKLEAALVADRPLEVVQGARRQDLRVPAGLAADLKPRASYWMPLSISRSTRTTCPFSTRTVRGVTPEPCRYMGATTL